ncbi:MAG TPA: fibronectin type III domain-containing protein [Methanocorpusculum sp.]|nr:fibronectin type III domain-containing protein [Methanocorpusculum sp.]
MKILFFCLSILGASLFSARGQTVIASYDFEDSTQYADWHFVNGNNGWYIGNTANVNNTVNGSCGLYISDDNGVTNAYSDIISKSWAYVDVAIPAGYLEFSLKFDWKCNGDNNYDYMKVYLGVPYTPSGNSAPLGAQILNNELRTSDQTYFNGYDGPSLMFYPGWNHYSDYFQEYIGDTVRLYFYWYNDYTVHNNPPITIDNITITGINCGRVRNMTAFPTSSDLTVSFSPALSTDNTWEYICVPKDSSINNMTPVSISDTSFTIANLQENTEYDVYIRTNCGNEIGGWTRQTFRTACVSISTLPYNYDFDLPINSFPDCWYKINTGTLNSPAINSIHYEGTGSLLFKTVPNSFSLTAMQAIDTSIAINTLMVTFMYMTTELQNSLIVGVMDNPLDESTFIAIDTIHCDIKNIWQEFDILLNDYTGTGHYITFKAVGGNTVYMDNLEVDYLPYCVRPVQVAINNVTATDVTVSWVPRGTEGEWEVVIVPYGEDPDSAVPEIVEMDTITITGLNSDMPYEVYVRSLCDGLFSDWTWPVTFRTGCPEYIIIPYSENFDGYLSEEYPACWSRLTNNIQSPRINSIESASGSHSLYFYATATKFSMAITPSIDTVNPVNTLSISFKMLKKNATYGYCEIGVMTDPTADSTFTIVKTVLATDFTETGIWKEFNFDLSNYSGTGNYIALRNPAMSTNQFYIDDVLIYETSLCVKPVNVEISQITFNTVTVDWTPHDESEWEIAVVPAGTDVSTAIPENAHRHPYFVTDLNDNTTYNVYVRAVCDDEVSIWSSAVTFTTFCAPVAITLPWIENFDNCETGENASLPDCWTKYVDLNSIYPTDLYSFSDSTSMCFDGPTGSECFYLVSPALDLSQYDTNTLLLTCKTFKNTTYSGRLDIGYVTDPADLNTFVFLKSIYPFECLAVDTWYSWNTLLPQNIPSPIYLVFKAPQGNTNEFYLDDVVLDYAPVCMDPSNLQISNITGSSALISWNESLHGAVDYTLEYSETGMNNWTSLQGIADNQFLLPGLLPRTHYDIRVFANCDNNTGNHLTGSFTTKCLAGGEINIGNGKNSYNFIPISSGYKYSYTQQIFDTNEMNGPTTIRGIKFDYAHTTPMTKKNDVNIYIVHTTKGVFDNNTDWIPIDSAVLVYSGNLNCTEPKGWNTFMFDTIFNYNGTDNIALILDDNSNDFDGTYFNFKVHPSPNKSLEYHNNYTNPDPICLPSGFKRNLRNNIIFIVDCDTSITCIAPNAIITSVDDQRVTLEWIPGNNESIWEIEYKLTSDTVWTLAGTVGNSPYVLDNLIPDSDYEIRIRSICSNDYSDWTTLSFTTECPPVATLPYIENFNLVSNDFFACWRRGSNADKIIYPRVDSLQYVTPPYSIYFHGDMNSYSYATTPRFDENIRMDSLLISFQMRKASATHYIEVGIITDPNDYSTFVPINIVSPSAVATWELVEISTEGYMGTGRYIAFRTPQWGTDNFYIDDVIIQYIPSCEHVRNLTVDNITAHSARITWSPGGNENIWEYLFGEPGTIDLNNDIPILITDSLIQLGNLNEGTNYEIYVRGRCQNGEYSAWNFTGFRTTCKIPTSLSSSVTTTTATLSWNELGDFEMAYKKTSENIWSSNITVNGNMTTIYDLLQGTDYDWRVRKVCDAGNYSNWVNSTFTTICGSPANLTSSVTTTSAILSWDWIGDFGEIAYKKTSETNWSDNIMAMGNTISVHNLIPNTDYDWRVRQVCNNVNSDWVNSTFTTLEIICNEPTGLTSSVTTTTATLSWTETGDFEMAYKLASTPDWPANTTVTGNSITITDLTPDTNYDWRIRQVCEAIIYSEWTNATFQTAAEPVCPTPTNLTVSNITDNSATLSWEQEENTAIEWTLNYKPANVNDWTISTITDNPYTITDLIANTDYEAKIRANCLNGINGDYTNILTFTTPVGIKDYTLSNSITLYPNPTSTYIDVKFNHNIRVSELNVYDVYGRLLQTIQVNENPTRINVYDLAAGVYFVRAVAENSIANKSFIKK